MLEAVRRENVCGAMVGQNLHETQDAIAEQQFPLGPAVQAPRPRGARRITLSPVLGNS